MNKLTYFMWIDEYNTDISPEEEMEEYLRENCPIPTDEELAQLETEIKQ